MKNREELVNSTYLNKAEIKRLLGITQYKAAELYEEADKIDAKTLTNYRLFPNKVRTKVVVKLFGTSFDELKKTIS